MVKKKARKFKLRVAIRFTYEPDYAAVHRAAEEAGLSMNAWMSRTLVEAARAAGVEMKSPWKRRENRNAAV